MEEKKNILQRFESKNDDYKIITRPVFNRERLNELIKRATPNLSKIKDVDAWIQFLRN